MWKHEPLTVAIMALLVAAVFGAAMAVAGVLPRGAPQLRVYVWYAALPSLILSVTMTLDLKGLGKVVSTFVQWRAVLLGAAVVDSLAARRIVHTADWRLFLLKTTESWLCFSWVSTVLVGLPMLLAVVDDPEQAVRLSLGSAISSFVFQLPAQIFVLELAVGKDEELSARGVARFALLVVERLLKNPVAWAICVGITLSRTDGGDDVQNDAYWRFIYEASKLLGACATPVALSATGTYLASKHQQEGGARRGRGAPLSRSAAAADDNAGDVDESKRAEDAHVVVVVDDEPRNDAATRGSTDLDKEKQKARDYLGQIDAAIRERACGLRSALLLVYKITAVPCLMYFLAQKDLNRRDRRGAVLLATTPCTSAAVVLAQKYGLDDDLLAQQAFWGLVLLLPTVLAW